MEEITKITEIRDAIEIDIGSECVLDDGTEVLSPFSTMIIECNNIEKSAVSSSTMNFTVENEELTPLQIDELQALVK